jgi:hypothetical protein
MENLRILHAHYPTIDYLVGLKNRPGNEFSTVIFTMQAQRFANSMFGELYKHPDFKLQALTIGYLGPLQRDFDIVINHHGDQVNDVDCMPQFCFIRGRQQDFLGCDDRSANDESHALTHIF